MNKNFPDKVVVVGSRSFTNYDAFDRVMKECGQFDHESAIISGGARGVDSLAKRWGKENMNGAVFWEFRANWGVHGKKAGILRNEEMAKKATRGMIFWDGVSRGTKHMIETMIRLKKPYQLFVYEPKTESFIKWRYYDTVPKTKS